MMRWILLLTIALGASLAQAELYKWVDAEGNVHYSDKLPPANARKSEKKKLTDKPSQASMPYSLQQAVKNFPVTLYSYDCGDGCARASALLAKRGVPHTTKDPLDGQVREEMRKVTGGEEIAPVLQVGRRVLKGFEEGQWNSALDNAGYPRTALMPAVPVAKPKPAAETPPANGQQETTNSDKTASGSD